MNKILKSTFILFIGTLVVKSIGMYFRSTLSVSLGSEGMGIYEMIFSVYLLIVTLAYSGVNIAVVRLSGEGKIYGRSLVFTAQRLIVPLSVAVGGVLFAVAPFVAETLLKAQAATAPLRILSFSVPFMSLSICFSSWYIGQGNTAVPVLCQIAEQTLRIIILKTMLKMGALPLVACAWAMSMGEVLSCIFIGAVFLKSGGRRGRVKRGIVPKILEICVPVGLGNYLSSGIGTAENILFPRMLSRHSDNALSQYGMLSGMVMPMITFPSALLTSLSTVLMPSVAKSGDGREVKPYLDFTLKASVLIASIFLFFPYRLGSAIYSSVRVGQYVGKLSFIVPLMYTESIISSALNGLGKQRFLVIINSAEQVAMLFVILFLVPKWGLTAYIGAMFAGAGITCFIKLCVMLKISDFSFDIAGMLVIPVLCAAFSGITAKAVCAHFLWGRVSLVLDLVIGIIIHATVYLVLMKLFNKKRTS